MGTDRGREMSWQPRGSELDNFSGGLSVGFSEKEEIQVEKRSHSPSSAVMRAAKQGLEAVRTSLIDRAWASGVQGRKRLEAGFTLEVVRKISQIKKVHGEADFDAAYSLVLWVVQEWPCDPPLSTVPVNPAKLGQDCAEMLYKYQPGVDETHPENSAYLLPSWLRPMVESLDVIEKRGAKCSHRLEVGGKMHDLEELERQKIREEGGAHGRNIWEGINDEIEKQEEEDRVKRATFAPDDFDSEVLEGVLDEGEFSEGSEGEGEEEDQFR
ncbi:hypothetical protein TrVE_jg11516 [Triparma verrucosa]|uniref:Uncharacterized protein n=1 Tax=Triparma verrucosa TaxID=1606542 RepID=A0A9W7C6K5_9STRA|nr:hypothetical protein TrVE_jg11516 [Triparma verrucosa]